MKMTPKIIFEFPRGVDKPPVVYPVADTDEETATLRKYADRIKDREKNQNDVK
jgi:hypothetical protein